jgi:hypothetical protein
MDSWYAVLQVWSHLAAFLTGAALAALATLLLYFLFPDEKNPGHKR